MTWSYAAPVWPGRLLHGLGGWTVVAADQEETFCTVWDSTLKVHIRMERN